MKYLSSLAILGLFISLIGCQSGPKKLETLDNEVDSLSYSLGVDIARNFTDQQIQVNPQALAQGMQEYLDGMPLVTTDEANNILSNFQRKMAMKAQEEAAGTNLMAAEEFLASNGKLPNIKTTNSGLQYEVLTEGSGASPTIENSVTCHYKGTLLNGRQFDSSYDRGEPATFPLQGVISAWQEALPMMKIGGKWKLYVHPNLGYGERGFPPDIGPNELLIFEIELLKIN